MNSFLVGALAGTAGTMGRYEQQQQEQQEYNRSQQLLASEDLRKRNFKRFEYEQKDLYGPSGMVDESGRELSKKEQQESGGSAMTPKHEWTRKQKELEAGQKEAKRVEILEEKRGYQEGKAEEKTAAAQTVTDAKYVKDTMKEVRQDIADADEKDTPGAKTVAILAKGDQQKDERFFNSPEYKDAVLVKDKSAMVAKVFESQKGLFSSREAEKKKTREILKRGRKGKDGKVIKGATDQELDKIFDYLDYYNTFE